MKYTKILEEYSFVASHWNLTLVEYEVGVPATSFRKIAVGSTVELHLYEVIGTASHPDMRKVRIVGFFSASRLRWQFESGKTCLQTAVLGYIFICVQIKR
jgi:hypothetical protein